MNTTRTQPTERKGLTHSLGMIAALIVATFVVGSLLFVMNAARQSTTSGTGAAPQQSIPNTSYGPGWKVVKTVNGTGSQTITGQNLIFHYTLGAALSCTGKGEIKVEFNGPHGKWFQEDCQKGEPGQIDFTIKIGAPYTVEKLDITTEKTNTWQLQILSCVDKNVCGKPGPVPTVSSTVEAPVPTNPAKH